MAAITSPSTELDICNMAINKCGIKAITEAQLTANTDASAIACNAHYAQTRDALLRSHWWRFAKARKALTANDTAPDFEWDYAFDLPDDFLREKSVFEDNNTMKNNTLYSYELEGSQLFTDESTCNLRYIKQVTTVTDFDPLFIEVFVLQLALKLVFPIAGVGSAGRAMAADIKAELYAPKGLMSRVRALDRKEGERIGRSDRPLWNNARVGSGRIPSRMGS